MTLCGVIQNSFYYSFRKYKDISFTSVRKMSVTRWKEPSMTANKRAEFGHKLS